MVLERIMKAAKRLIEMQGHEVLSVQDNWIASYDEEDNDYMLTKIEFSTEGFPEAVVYRDEYEEYLTKFIADDVFTKDGDIDKITAGHLGFHVLTPDKAITRFAIHTKIKDR